MTFSWFAICLVLILLTIANFVILVRFDEREGEDFWRGLVTVDAVVLVSTSLLVFLVPYHDVPAAPLAGIEVSLASLLAA